MVVFHTHGGFRVLVVARMGAESSSLLSGVTIDSSPILTTQDWSLHHAQVNYAYLIFVISITQAGFSDSKFYT